MRVARIGIVYGPGFTVLLEDAVREGKAWLPGEGRNMLPIIHVDDCVAALQLLMERGQDGTVTHVSTAQPVSSREFYEAVAQRVGGRPTRFWSTYVPTRVQHGLAGLYERALSRTSKRPLFTPDMLKLLTASVRLKPERLEKELEFSWRYPDLASGMDATFSGGGR